MKAFFIYFGSISLDELFPGYYYVNMLIGENYM